MCCGKNDRRVESARAGLAFQGLAPGGAALACIHDEGQDVPLHPAEASLVAGASTVRRRDFALGRACAHAALTRLGIHDVVLGKESTGAPLWPSGLVGAITHTQGFAAALAGRSDRFAAMGLDAERVGGVDAALAARLFPPAELAWLAEMEETRRCIGATLCFSAREAYYKAFHPLERARLDFHQVDITLPPDMPDGGVFTARQPGGSARWRTPLRGRYLVRGDLVVTQITIRCP